MKRYLKAFLFAIPFFYIVQTVINLIHKSESQWDFLAYYFPTQLWYSGQSPYLCMVQEHPFFYTPLSLGVFLPFTFLPLQTALWTFLGLKIVALLALLYIWYRYFLLPLMPDDSWKSLSILFVAVLLFVSGFRECVKLDIFSGNISIFEQLLIWTGIAAFLRNKDYLFVGCILVCSIFKVLPIALLGLLLLKRDKKSTFLFLKSSAFFLGMFLVAGCLSPVLFREFLTHQNPMESRGFVHPSSLMLLQDIAPHFAFPLYVLFVSIIAGLFVYFIYRFRPALVYGVIGYLICYALILPRFKDYSFILLIIPAVYVIQRIGTKWVVVPMLWYFCSLSHWEYHHWGSMVILFGSYLISLGSFGEAGEHS